MSGIQNLRPKPFTKENAKEMGSRGGKKKKENELKRKAMREIYEQIIAEEGEKIRKAILKGLDNGNIMYIKELREGTEGKTLNISGTVKTEMESTEDRVKLFEELVGKEK